MNVFDFFFSPDNFPENLVVWAFIGLVLFYSFTGLAIFIERLINRKKE